MAGFPIFGGKMKIIIMTGLLLKIVILSAQVVPLKAAEWVFRPGAVEFGDSAETECFYFRTARGAGHPYVMEAVLKPGKVEGLSPIAATDPTANDQRYLRHWQMTTPDTLAPGIDFTYGLMPGKETGWQPIDAERRGLINLTRKWVVNRTHQLIWLKTTIHAEAAGRYTLRLGFVDEVWLFLDGLTIERTADGR